MGCSPEGGSAACPDCLRRLVLRDLAGSGLSFVYGLSDSPLPFAASAVVQIASDGDEGSIGRQHISSFVLVGLCGGKVPFNSQQCDNSSLENCIHKDPQAEQTLYNGDNEYTEQSDSSSCIECIEGCKSSSGPCKQPLAISTITKLAPACYLSIGHTSEVRELITGYLTSSSEEYVINSLNLLFENKISGSAGLDFLSFVGFSAFDDLHSSGCVRHPNILPVLGILETSDCCYMLQPKAPYTLENIMHYSPEAFCSDWHIRFLVYQIISAVAYLHDLGVHHGNLRPSKILMSDSLWPYLSISDTCPVKHSWGVANHKCSPNSCCFMEDCSSKAIYSGFKLQSSLDWHSHFKQWWKGELSNYEYLLVLNKLAGRRWGDPGFHTVMPWVIDFTGIPDESSDNGWRDLTKSKWRLAKGDEQLDFTYSSSEVPHHVSDECLSELAVCSYKARRLPKTILRSAVRSVYEPNEYPSSMQRLYQWTPDECIPEFYSDPQIFTSLHSEMSDLALPSWATSAADFIYLHRDALESDRVSQQLHHWIDITFGYKLSGEASVEAKNVMLPSNDPSRPKSIGRHQLFTRPHPKRLVSTPHAVYHNNLDSCARCCGKRSGATTDAVLNGCGSPNMVSEIGRLEEFEKATLFAELEYQLNPVYDYADGDPSTCFSSNKYPKKQNADQILQHDNALPAAPNFDLGSFLECFESDDNSHMGYQELLLWNKKSNSQNECHANDVFSIGCILAEIYVQKPLFDNALLSAYKEIGIMPGALQGLPSHVTLLVESCIQREWKRRPSAKHLLESSYFPPSVRSAYMFLAPLQVLSTSRERIKYAAKLASEGALKAMGEFAAEMCAPYCLSLLSSSLSDVDTESALSLLKEFLGSLTIQATKDLVLHIIQKILQAPEYSHLKVAFLQDSFIRDLWKKLGKKTYIEKIHPLVISNLYSSPNKIIASAASTVLIVSSEELGIPITIHQTILPLIHCFGKGLCADGINTLVRIGGLLGENFVVKQILPLLLNVIFSCIDSSKMSKPEPQHSWNSFALIDSLSALEGLVLVLPVKTVIKELLQDQACLYVKVLMQIPLDLRVIQVAATALIDLCQRIGPENTSIYVLPQLKELFAELAFSHDSSGLNHPIKGFKSSDENKNKPIKVESRIDLLLLLYPFLASLVGIEKLRESCSTWFLLEQALQRLYNWKWEPSGDCSKNAENMKGQRLQPGNYMSSEFVPTKLLFNGVGWSMPQSETTKKNGRNTAASNLENETSSDNLSTSSSGNQPWFWFPTPDSSWGVPEFLGRGGGLRDELPWKIKASILYSARAHPGALRSLAVHDDECTVFTGGVGPGFKGSIQRWELPNMNCTSGYYGHEEVVNSICILSITGRVASCDGTIHIWNGQSGKLIAAHAESSTTFPLQTPSIEQANMLNQDALSGGILSNAFRGSLYTTMHYMESEGILVAGMGNGSIRFIDISQDQKLHLWKSDTAEISFSSLVSAICSCGSNKLRKGSLMASSWIAAGLSSGYCRLLDKRSGNIIAVWRAHDGHITKLAAPDDHLILSSSLDKTLRVWDLRRNLATQSNIFRSHSDGISNFSVWGQDVVSISRNKIALTSLSRPESEQIGHQQLALQNLYSADRGVKHKNLSVLSTIAVLPLSRLFVVGTEDGFLKMCH
ncbi:protein GFS12 isoform X1 [Zea mays]|uniref:protein GFS12 isoform X1 n=1 Tax=Zea mays TaxID=4577 RepID=UPI0004DE97ED|nr:protein GFS12 isoform X1 [Zea mays]XP_008674007.1 protein GFS12 isoform X1 [Zea mays]|eukprot:XP_008674005.1 protein GFS12 isoform X1 [Zea mays]